MADPADYALAGISPRQVPADLPPGRALVGPDARRGAAGVLDVDTSGAGQVAAVERVAAQVRARVPVPHGHPGLLPMRVEPLPGRVEAVDIAAAAKEAAPGPAGRWSVSAVTSSSRSASTWTLDGPAFVVAGPSGSGRSTTLATMGRWLLGQGRRVVVIGHRRSPLQALAGDPGVLAVLGPGDAAELEQQLAAHPDLVVLADDAETLHDTPVERPARRACSAPTPPAVRCCCSPGPPPRWPAASAASPSRPAEAAPACSSARCPRSTATCSASGCPGPTRCRPAAASWSGGGR